MRRRRAEPEDAAEEAETFQPLGQRAREQDVGQLALGVGFGLAVALLAVQVLQVDGAPGVSHGRHSDDAGRGGAFDQVHQ